MEEQDTGYCKYCQQQVRITRTTPNHLLHLALTLLTGGLWFIVWLFDTNGAWRCIYCGNKVRKRMSLFWRIAILLNVIFLSLGIILQ